MSNATASAGPQATAVHFDVPVFNSGPPPAPLAEEMRRAAIREAAYFLAEKRGFAPGAELDDWLAAEAQVDRRMQALAHATP
jgi:hypothetical protein